MILPTTELLSAVLDDNVFSINTHISNKDTLTFYKNADLQGSGDNDYINIYELMHLMIIWGAKQNFRITPELSYGIERGRARLEYTQNMGFNIFGYDCQHTYKSHWFDADSMPEPVTEACLWILNNKD